MESLPDADTGVGLEGSAAGGSTGFAADGGKASAVPPAGFLGTSVVVGGVQSSSKMLFSARATLAQAASASAARAATPKT